MSEPVAPWLTPDWRDRAPAMLTDLEDPDGNPLPTHFDRRWLWRIESFLAINGTNESHHAMRHDLYQYLCLTCEHVWRETTDYDDNPLQQCLWCNEVVWL